MAIHRLVRDTIMMKKYMAKSNVVLGRGAPHLLGGKVEPRPLRIDFVVVVYDRDGNF